MTAISPLILAYEPVLRHLADAAEGDVALTPKAVAQATGKVVSNLIRDLDKLRDAGVISPEPAFAITEAGLAALRGLDVAAGRSPPPTAGEEAAGAGLLRLRHDQIVRDPHNPRTVFATEELGELADSILELGLIEPLVVRPADRAGAHRLIAGERRWRAIGQLVEMGHWTADRLVPCMVQDIDDAQHALMALVENLQRVDLDKVEEADALDRLVNEFGLTTAEVATKIGRTQRHVQRRLLLTGLDPEGRRLLSAREITVEQAEERLKDPKHNLTPEQALVLVEVAHKLHVSPDGKTYAGEPYTRARAPTDSALWKSLSAAQLIWVHHAGASGGRGVYLLKDGLSLLARLGLNPQHDPAILDKVREAAGLSDRQRRRCIDEGRYATDWLNPLFNAQMRLALVELAWKLELGGPAAKSKTSLIVDSNYNDPLINELAQDGLISTGSGNHDGSWLSYVTLTKDGLEKLKPILAGRKPSQVLAEERQLASGKTSAVDPKSETAVTKFLNSPNFLKNHRERQAKKEREAVVGAQAAGVLAEAKALGTKLGALFDAGQTFETLENVLPDLLTRSYAPAPWYIEPGDPHVILDSRGVEVMRVGGYSNADGFRKAQALLVVAAVNLACGLRPIEASEDAAPDEADADDEDAPDPEAQYLNWIAKRLVTKHHYGVGLGLDALVRRILDAELTRNGIAFGDPDYDWSEADAIRCADEGFEDLQGQEATA